MAGRARTWAIFTLVLFSFLSFFSASVARAEKPSPALLTRLAAHAAAFEAMRTQASYAVSGRLEELDGDGKADGVKEMRARVESDGAAITFVVLSYTEDGEDKTDEAKKKAKERAEKKAKDAEAAKKKELKMPFLATEQPRYVFEIAERDKADASRLRVTFVPVDKDETTIEGSAWVDERAGTVLSAGFKLSRTSMWIDYMHIQVEFGAATSLGPAVSKVSMDGKGGILFLRKRFHAQATLSDWRIARETLQPH
jgi:hypothetical protein